MTNYNTTVFDTETCGIDNGSIILTLSAVKFDRNTSKLELNTECEFHVNLSISEQILKGRTIEKGTIAWWNKQSKEAQNAAFYDEQESVKEALEEFFEFVEGTQVYCRGTDFDPPKLASLCKDFGVKMPIKYNAFRDVRTYIDALTDGTKGYIENDEPQGFVAHNSLCDCWRDAMQMVHAKQSTFVKPEISEK
ncbi:3'-5' exoribonuclease domain-containing protein [Methylophaga sp.]|uniref:3'-5' exoribonuclease domain-containing protein n=1 Tax=Methylophaga sp. TaxID=2024840 RepID=UPI003A952726